MLSIVDLLAYLQLSAPQLPRSFLRLLGERWWPAWVQFWASSNKFENRSDMSKGLCLERDTLSTCLMLISRLIRTRTRFELLLVPACAGCFLGRILSSQCVAEVLKNQHVLAFSLLTLFSSVTCTFFLFVSLPWCPLRCALTCAPHASTCASRSQQRD